MSQEAPRLLWGDNYTHVYTPDSLIKGVKIFGKFAGSETSSAAFYPSDIAGGAQVLREKLADAVPGLVMYVAGGGDNVTVSNLDKNRFQQCLDAAKAGVSVDVVQAKKLGKLVAQPFYVIRHGQTEDNERGLISGGGRNPDLTELGRIQAATAGEVFALLDPQPERIIASSLVRTHQTAQIVTGHGNFIQEPRINERHLGELDGQITEAAQKAMGTLPGEESSESHARRVVAAINDHLVAGGTPMFFPHAGSIRRLLEASGIKDRVEVGNAKIYHFTPGTRGWSVAELAAEQGEIRRKDITTPQRGALEI